MPDYSFECPPLPPSRPRGRHQSAQCWRRDKVGRETMLYEDLVLLTAVSVTLTICSCVVMCFCACANCTCVRGDPHTSATTTRSDLAQSPPPPSSSSPPPLPSSSSSSQPRVPADASQASTSINMGPVTSCSRIEVEENPLPSYEEVIKALP